MNNQLVVEKAMEKKEYLKTLYSENHKQWNKIIDEFVEDMEFTIKEYSDKPIREESCLKELKSIARITQYFLIYTHLKKSIMSTSLSDSCYSNYGVSDRHELRVDFNTLEICFKHDAGEYKKGIAYNLPIEKYFKVNEEYFTKEQADRWLIFKRNEEIKNSKTIQETCNIWIDIVMNTSDRIDYKKFEERGFCITPSGKQILIRKFIGVIGDESIRVEDIFDLGAYWFKITFDSVIHNECMSIIIKDTKNWRNNIKINKYSHTSENFIKIVKKYLDI